MMNDLEKYSLVVCNGLFVQKSTIEIICYKASIGTQEYLLGKGGDSRVQRAEQTQDQLPGVPRDKV